MSSRGLTEQDRQRLTQIKTQFQKQGSPTKIENCHQLRVDFKHGKSLDSLCGEYDAARETVRKHLKGQCICESSLDAVGVFGHEKARYKTCPHEGCGFSSRFFENLTDHIRKKHAGGGE